MKKNFFAFLLIFLFSNNSIACEYVADSAEVYFTAFKTEKKAAVTGRLKKISVAINKALNSTVEDAMTGSGFDIDASRGNVDSGDAARDLKIANFFFGNLEGGAKISGLVESAKAGRMVVAITMNNVTQPIHMRYQLNGDDLQAVGWLDMLSQFKATKAHQEIGKACEVKHEKKTWSDVEIELKAKFRNCGPKIK